MAFKWGHGAPGIPRPGQCYLCRKRPGTIAYRSFWVCRQCMTAMYVKDVLAIVLMLGTFGLLLAVARSYGYCPVCPAIHLPGLPSKPNH